MYDNVPRPPEEGPPAGEVRGHGPAGHLRCGREEAPGGAAPLSEEVGC